jgi:3-polyprenyl-4-hydroxybenzoate decarboxylase
MRVYPDFPSTSVEARAVIVVEALHARGEFIYRATYTGEATRSGVNVRAQQIEETLIDAMGHALDEVVMDDRLQRAVESASN